MSPTKDEHRPSPHPFDVFGLLNLVLPEECVAGIEANLELMKVHARRVEAFDFSNAQDKANDE